MNWDKFNEVINEKKVKKIKLWDIVKEKNSKKENTYFYNNYK